MTLPPPRHGGIDEARLLLPGVVPEGDVLDFSINVNPLGPPDGLTEALEEALEAVTRYPEVSSDTLAKRLADSHGLTPEHLIVGNGTADLLFALLPQFSRRRAAIPYPTFIEYERACGVYGWDIRHIPPANTRDFSFDLERIEAALADGVILFLCQPNNPTGRCLPSAAVEWILEEAARKGGVVVLDEAFLPFTDAPSFVPWVTRFERLIVLRSMTKSFAIPGLRLGYAAAAPRMIEAWKRFLPPWNVNALAQAAGLFCLEREKEYLTESRRFVRSERERLMIQIREVPFLHPLPSEANFFLVFLDPAGGIDADALYPDLAKQGLLVRHCGSFRGMGSRHIRIGLKTRPENQRLLDSLWNLFSKPSRAGEGSIETTAPISMA